MTRVCLFPWMTVTIVGVVLSSVLAHDVVRPAWRAHYATTYEEWRFDIDHNPAVPETIHNGYGSAEAAISLGIFAVGWRQQLPGLGMQTNYWDIGGDGGSIVIDIDDQAPPVDYRDIQVQVTYFRDITQAPYVDVPGATFLSGQNRILIEHVITGGDWYVDQSLWRITPGVGLDQIVVLPHAMGSIIDQIVVDTVSVASCHDPFADADGDGDVDQEDFGIWQACRTFPGGGVPDDCGCFDRDSGGMGDGDIDQDDFDAFQACSSGPDILADIVCDD